MEATSVEALVFSALLVAVRIGDATWEDACVGELAALLVLEQHTCARHDEESRQDSSEGGGESVETQQDRSEAMDSSEVRPADFGVLWALLLELASAVASSTHAHARSLLHHEASLHKFHEAADMMRASAIEQVHSAAAALSLGPCPACLRAKAGGGGVTLGGGGMCDRGVGEALVVAAGRECGAMMGGGLEACKEVEEACTRRCAACNQLEEACKACKQLEEACTRRLEAYKQLEEACKRRCAAQACKVVAAQALETLGESMRVSS